MRKFVIFLRRLEEAVPSVHSLGDFEALCAWLTTPSVESEFERIFVKLEDGGEKTAVKAAMVGLGLGELSEAAAAAAAAAAVQAAAEAAAAGGGEGGGGTAAADRIFTFPDFLGHAPSLSPALQETVIGVFKNDTFRRNPLTNWNYFGAFQAFWKRFERAVPTARPQISDIKTLGSWPRTPSIQLKYTQLLKRL